MIRHRRKWPQESWVILGLVCLTAENLEGGRSLLPGTESTRTALNPTGMVSKFSIDETGVVVVPFGSVNRDVGGIMLRFHAEAGLVYTVFSRASLRDGQWKAMTNVASKFLPVDAEIKDAPADGHRFYRLAITGQVD